MNPETRYNQYLVKSPVDCKRKTCEGCTNHANNCPKQERVFGVVAARKEIFPDETMLEKAPSDCPQQKETCIGCSETDQCVAELNGKKARQATDPDKYQQWVDKYKQAQAEAKLALDTPTNELNTEE